MEKRIITRKELYDLVCAKPLTKLAAENSISVNGLRKVTCEHNLKLMNS